MPARLVRRNSTYLSPHEGRSRRSSGIPAPILELMLDFLNDKATHRRFRLFA